MKKLVAFILLVALTLSLVACKDLTSEQKDAIQQTENLSKEYISKYLEDKYSGAKVLNTKQSVRGDTLYGFHVDNVVKHIVLMNGEEYQFYHNVETNIVYSDVCYDKVILELDNRIKENELIAKASTVESEIMSYIIPDASKMILRDEHETLDDVLNYMKSVEEKDVEFSISIRLCYDIEITEEEQASIKEYINQFPHSYVSIWKPSKEEGSKETTSQTDSTAPTVDTTTYPPIETTETMHDS